MLKKLGDFRLNIPKKRLINYIAVGLTVSALTIIAPYLKIQDILCKLLIWIEHLESGGPLAFILIYNIATILFIPGLVLTLGGGVIYGWLWGSVYVSISAILGAIAAFAIGRYLSRDWVANQMSHHPKFRAIEDAVTRSGIKIVFLTRLCPIIPFNLLNYAFGVTQISLKDYTLGSIGMIPGIIMYVYLGSIIGDLAAIATPDMMSANPQAVQIKWIINGIGAITTIAVTIYLAKIGREALEQQVK